MDDATLLVSLPVGLVTLADARRVGIDPRALYLAERRGALTRVRPGVFVRSAELDGRPPEVRHAFAVRAAAGRLDGGVFSHESAAVMWGLPLLEVPREVHLTVARRTGGASGPGVVRRTRTGLVPSVEREGVVVTPVLETLLDLAAERPFANAVVPADHAMRARQVTSDALVAGAEAMLGRRGGRRALAVARFASARSESVGESLSRARMHELGLPAPTPQVRLRDGDGDIGRVDFWWPEARLVGEFDGRLKYRTDGITDRRAVEERLWAEKRREDRLRATGCRVARWTWDDALEPARLERILTRAGLRRTL